jgi:hypothetical protein
MEVAPIIIHKVVYCLIPLLLELDVSFIHYYKLIPSFVSKKQIENGLLVHSEKYPLLNSVEA